MNESPRIRWLGVAGIELEYRGARLLIDPYVTRLPMRFLLGGRPLPNAELVRRLIPPACAVLVSHAHFDHLLDIPVVCRDLGAAAYGSANTCQLLAAAGVSAGRIIPIQPGACISAAPLEVAGFAGVQGRTLGLEPHAGRLRAGLRYPFRLDDYRLDGMFSFRVSMGDRAVLVWNSPSENGVPRADVLVYVPLLGADACIRIVRASGARAVLPVHWENFFSPLDRPMSPLVAPPGWGRLAIRKIAPDSFLRQIVSTLSGVAPVRPEIFVPVSLE